MSDENDPYYTDAEERRQAINAILECTKYWPCTREHRVFKGLLAEITRLRADLAKANAENAALSAEISRVRLGELRVVIRLRADLAQRTAERDEARRMACVSEARYQEERKCPLDIHCEHWIQEDAKRIAAERGWDCFAPHANTTDVPVQNGGA
jgi:hypothetical protein